MIVETVTTFAALILVMGLIFGMLWLSRRFNLVPGQVNRRGAQKEIEVLETQLLSNNTRLVAVRWRGRDMLLGVGPQGASLISGPGTLDTPSFKAVLDKAAQDSAEESSS